MPHAGTFSLLLPFLFPIREKDKASLPFPRSLKRRKAFPFSLGRLFPKAEAPKCSTPFPSEGKAPSLSCLPAGPRGVEERAIEDAESRRAEGARRSVPAGEGQEGEGEGSFRGKRGDGGKFSGGVLRLGFFFFSVRMPPGGGQGQGS